MIAPAKLRQILELRRGADEAKKGSNNQHKEILDIHVQLRPWRVTTANELFGKDSSVELPNVFAVEFQLENAAKYIRLDMLAFAPF
uniref:Uncharacterized protein n=1 Tax=Globodera pallida TaxID=36090 RepID=A0A183BKT8_GLOPA